MIETRHISRPSATSRKLGRLLALLASMAVLFAAPAAWASPVGMCDETAQSVAAPFPILPTDNGVLAAGGPCDGKLSHELGRAPAPDPKRQLTTPELPPRYVPGSWSFPRDRGQRLPPAEAGTAVGRSGFRASVFRPPRLG